MDKRGDIKDYTFWMIVAAVVLVIGVLGILVIKSKTGDNLSFVENIFRFRRA